MFRVLKCHENQSPSGPSNSLECRCIRPPLPNTIQAFDEEINTFMSNMITEVSLENCTSPHYNMRINIDEDTIKQYTFQNFISGKFILEGEVKDNISIQFENFQGPFNDIVGLVKLRGVLRCFNSSSGTKKVLKIKFVNVESVLIENLYVKDNDESCIVNVITKDAKLVKIKGGSFTEVVSDIEAETCVWNDVTADCKDLFKLKDVEENYTVRIVVASIMVMTVGAVAFIVFKK